jgi:bifunctional NMN adenylyltransferase/nudix hydrolase
MADTKCYSSVGVVIARFQVSELHPGHKHLLRTVADRHGRLCAVLGVSPLPTTTRNPLPFEAREMAVKSSGIEEWRTATVVPLADHPSDAEWSQNLDRLLTSLFPKSQIVLYTADEGTIASYSGRLQITRTDPLAEHGWSGTQIRGQQRAAVVDDPLWRQGVIWATGNRFPCVHSVVDIWIYSLYKPNEKHDAYELNPHVLLGQKRTDDPTKWRIPGGFADGTDCSLRNTVLREAQEETGLLEKHVPSVTYIHSLRIPDWRYQGVDNEFIMSSMFGLEVRWEVLNSLRAGDDLARIQLFAARQVKHNIHPVHTKLSLYGLEHIEKRCTGLPATLPFPQPLEGVE